MGLEGAVSRESKIFSGVLIDWKFAIIFGKFRPSKSRYNYKDGDSNTV